MEGLINNVLYVIILSAALDLVGPSIPKGVVLLADVIPSFVVKLFAPYFIHAIPYWARILLFVGLSVCGMLLIALTPPHTDGGTISTKLAGVILASLSSGGGELSFLGLTHFYGKFGLAAWGSGTGGAGLIGAGLYALATTSWGLAVQTTLLISAFLPAVLLISFFLILPQAPLGKSDLVPKISSPSSSQLSATMGSPHDDNDDVEQSFREDEGLLARSDNRPTSRPYTTSPSASIWANLKANIKRARRLFFPLYDLPDAGTVVTC